MISPWPSLLPHTTPLESSMTQNAVGIPLDDLTSSDDSPFMAADHRKQADKKAQLFELFQDITMAVAATITPFESLSMI